MKYFLFTDFDSGEDFIVKAKNAKIAVLEAKMYFADPGKPEVISEEEVNMLGLDIY